MPIRYKLTAVMSIPTLALALLVGYEIAGLAASADEIRGQAELATSADGPSGLIISLQNERNWAVVELIGQGGGGVNVSVEGYPETRQATDAAREGFQEDLAGGQDQTIEAYSPAVEGLSELAALRQSIDDYTGPRTLDAVPFANMVFEGYKQLIQPFLEGISEVADVVDHTDLRQGAALIDKGIRQSETIGNVARQTIVYAILSEGGINELEEIAELAALRDRMERYAALLEDSTNGLYTSAGNPGLFRDFTAALSDQVTAAIRGDDFDLQAFLDTVSVPDERSYIGYERRVAEILTDKADSLNADAARTQRLYLGIILVVGALALVAMWMVSRSITRSLRSLTGHAADIARRRLPGAVDEVLESPLGRNLKVPSLVQVEVGTHDEVADVASALDTVQTAALNLAVRQAVLWRNLSASFVNLGRRNQNLLRRQLSFISQLEHGETDPDNLANLFHLDHLATRMRRNADSLVVLGGIDPARPQTSPVRIADVIRAAVSEVEDYQRVTAPAVERVEIVGGAGADLVHLLAELVDNALAYSPPDQRAEIRGLAHPAGYTLMVIDRGLGMPPDEIALANRRLAGAERFNVAPSKYLGHYVAGHLAARHGIQVRLQGAPTHGITATVHLPLDLLARKPREDEGSDAWPGSGFVGQGSVDADLPLQGNRRFDPRQVPAVEGHDART